MGYGLGHSPREGVFLNGRSNWSVSSHRRGLEGENAIVFKQLWRCKALPSALVTAWRVLENKLATRVNLEKRGIAVESPLCSLCRVEVESNNHLFRLCNVSTSANEMWGVIQTAVVSELWKHRNNVIFNGGVVDGLEVVALVQVKAWSWITSKPLSGLFSFSEWCLELLICMMMVS
ncbi:uncharacterized protein [Phaseolus vulgaris]|uniref:uncharacterized protein n=1 Tax=Phaseolus vulgaris TaxID=3885 RepID=UPI0035C9A0DC